MYNWYYPVLSYYHQSNATSIHQAQGATFERAVTCLDRTSTQYGMENVAMSRVKNEKHLALLQSVSQSILQPRPYTSELVEAEYKRCSNVEKHKDSSVP